MEIEFNNISKLKYNIIKKYNKNTKYDKLIKECNKHIYFCNINRNLCDLYNPTYWIIEKEINNKDMKLVIDNNTEFIQYNDIVIPSFVDTFKIKKELNINKTTKQVLNIYFNIYYLFNNLSNKNLKNKKTIYYLGTNIKCEKNKNILNTFNSFIKDYLKLKGNIVNTCVELNLNKQDVNLKDNNINNLYSNYKDLDKLIIKNKFDIGYILYRDYINDSVKLDKDIFIKRLKYILNFICKNCNLNSSFIIYFYGSYNDDFDNMICYLTQLFNSVKLHSFKFGKFNYNHIWIILNDFKGSDMEINFLEKKDFYSENSLKIKNEIFNFRYKLLIQTLNKYYYLNDKLNKKFEILDIKDNILEYLDNLNIPKNILYNELLYNSNIKYHDMQLLINNFNYDNVNYIIEYNMNNNTFLYISSIYTQYYNKNIGYSLINSILNVNEYNKAFNFIINISYEINNKFNFNNSLTIITNNNINNKIFTKFILTTNKIFKLLNLNTQYKIHTKGKEYFIFKKI
jgi:hypothetical protein